MIFTIYHGLRGGLNQVRVPLVDQALPRHRQSTLLPELRQILRLSYANLDILVSIPDQAFDTRPHLFLDRLVQIDLKLCWIQVL